MSTEPRAIGLARAWLGTPFRAGASVQGVGTDCAGLIEGIASALDIPFPHGPQSNMTLPALQPPHLCALIHPNPAP
jgi:cell wall-associated NlpC family hydrolase